MSRKNELAQRRKELLVHSAVMRTDMLADAYLMRYAATPARIGSDLLRAVSENKLMIAGVVLALIVIKPRRILAGLKGVVVGWQMLRNVTPLLQNFQSLLKGS